MADPGPSKSRILAALDLTDDDPSPLPLPLPTQILSRHVGEKRKRGTEYTGAVVTPLNKRQTYGTSRVVVNRLPAGLLANTQSPDVTVTDSTLTPEERSARETHSVITAAFRRPSALDDPLSGEFRLGMGYDVDSPLTSIDFAGDDQEQRLAEFVSKSIDNLAQDMQVQDGMKYLGLRDAKDIIPGMEVRLIPHQTIGVSWMLMQEKETNYRGGIMADEMGLGKTVQMIATMAMNMPDPDENNRTTLVVVPAALLHQWKDELESKTNNVFSVHIHHGKTKLKSLSALREKDVIITTYQTLCLDFVIKDPVDPEDEARWLTEYGGPMARMKWYRVVLDEAQFIRNRNTRASKVVAQLRAKYRWMLTGTPVTNTLADIYGLIRFGHFRPWNDWPSFHDHVTKIQAQDAPLAGARAQGILKPILLRRTKDSKLEGKPLLTLPPKTIELDVLRFSPEEREIYDDFEKQAKIRVNKFIRERTIMKNHHVVLVMILRLRQLCCHPHLILIQADEHDDPTLLVSGESEKELARARRLMGPQWVAKLEQRALARARAIELDFTTGGNEEEDTMCPVCQEIYEYNGRILKCGHEVCADCLEDMSNSAIVHDGIFGFGNERQNINSEKLFEDAAAKGFRPCPVCKKMNDISPNAIFLSSAFEPSSEELRAFARSEKERSRPVQDRKQPTPVLPKSKPPAPRRPPSTELIELSSDEEMPDFSEILAGTKKGKAKAKGPADVKPRISNALDSSDDESGEAKPENRKVPPVLQKGKQLASSQETKKPSQQTVATWRRGDDNMEPSAKMLALIEQLRIAENAGDKTIVYSQWTSMLDLLETLLARYGIQNLRYDGKMRSEARDATLVAFRKAGGPRVILISIKCGGVGLNLTIANRVMNMDLSWNYAAESQAYDRVHRLGQEKDVFVKRVVVENTIEERMLRLQDVKMGLADAALGEGTGVKLNKLSVREIKALFGMTPSQNPVSSQQPESGDD